MLETISGKKAPKRLLPSVVTSNLNIHDIEATMAL